MIGIDDIHRAASCIEGIAHRTPVLTSHTLDAIGGSRVFLKAENFQRAGAFKFRGAYNKISSLSSEELANGVAAYSSGNHAQAVALASRLVGTHATIVMPRDTPAAKMDATRGYRAEIVLYDRYSEDREEIGSSLAARRNLTLIPPYEDRSIMAGQGTAALELLDETGPLDALVVPVGGGGLIAGCATVAAAMSPPTRVVGVEPISGDDTKRSLHRGERVSIPVPRTIADGQQATIPGEMTFEVNLRLVHEIQTVGDDEILDAMLFAFDRLKIVLEPSGAAGLAAVLAGRVASGRRIGVILSGGNVGAARFAALVARRAGRGTAIRP